MQMIKIEIPDRQQRAQAFVEMGRRGRIVCLPENIFIVPEPALELLTKMGVQYQELGRGGFEYVETELRDFVAPQV